MKNFFEKLKDILYDGVDYLIMIAIVIGIVLIINWRLDGLFAENSGETYSKTSEIVEKEDKSSNSNSSEDKKEDKSKDVNPSESEKKEEPEDSNSSENEEKADAVVSIEVPAGSASSNIGDILISKGLIKDKKTFLDKLKELNLEPKLRHGKYEIPENSSLEEILKILTK